MKIDREELINVLSILKPGLSKKSIIEQTTHFIFTGKELLTYNDRICVLYPFKTDFSCSVPAEEFYKILIGIHCDEVELSFEKEKMLIIGENIKASLATDTGEDIIDRVKSLSLAKAIKKKALLPKDFFEALSLCIFSASKDATRPVFTGILIEDKYVASTDGIRISEYKMKSSIDDVVLIPATSVDELLKFNAEYFYIDKTWIYFIDKNNAIFATILLNEEYPDYTRILKGFDTKEIVLPDNMQQIIETSSILAEGDFELDKEIIVEISQGKIKCKGQNEKGSIVYNRSIDYYDEDLSFVINPYCLSKILSHTQSMFYGENKVMFKDKSFKHIIALGQV